MKLILHDVQIKCKSTKVPKFFLSLPVHFRCYEVSPVTSYNAQDTFDQFIMNFQEIVLILLTLPCISSMKENQLDELARFIVRSIADPLVVLNEKFEYIYYNDAAKEINHFDRVVLGENIWTLFPDLEFSWFKAGCEEAMDKKVPVHFEEYFPRYEAWAEISIYPFRNGITILFNSITNRKSKELADLMIIRRNSLIVQAMGDMYILVDKELNILDVNKSTCQILSYAKEELLQKNLASLDCLYQESIMEKIMEADASPQTTFLKTCFLDKKRDKHLLELNIVPLKSEKAAQYGLIGRDVSELHKAHEKLRKSNERFELLGSIAQDALWEIDTDTGEMWANEIHQEYYGLTAADPIPGSVEWLNRIHPDDIDEVRKSEMVARETGANRWEQEYRFRTESRGWIDVYDRTYILRHPDGRIRRMLGSMLDVTHLKQTRQSLLNEKKLSDSIINSLPGTFYLFDENYKILRWNENLSQISRFSNEEIAEMSAVDFFDEDQISLVEESLKQVFEEGYVETEALVNTKNQQKVPFYLTGKKVVLDGKNFLLGTGINLTKLKETEQKLQRVEQEVTNEKVQAQKRVSRAIIKAQEKERNHLAAELHDNINQLLAGTRLYLNMACKTFPDAKETISYPIELLDQAIEEIRSLSHKYITPQKYVNLEKLLKTLIERIEKSTEMQVHLQYKVDEDLMEDELKVNLYRIAQEQANNIIRHSGSRVLRFRLKTTEDYVEMITQDEGIGFNPREKKEGVGLNNIINRVEAFNGHFHIESAHQKGTTIYIYIPLQARSTT